MKTPTVSGSSSCRARAPPSASWRRKPWRDPSSASSRPRSPSGKDSAACLLPQKHRSRLQRGGNTTPKTPVHHQQSPAKETNQNPALGRQGHSNFQLQRRRLKFRLPQKLKMKCEEMTLVFLKTVRDERIKKGILYLEKNYTQTHT